MVESATALEYEDRPSFEELLKTLESDEMRARARAADQAAAAAPRVPRASKLRSSCAKEAADRSSGDGVMPMQQKLPQPGKKGPRFSAWLHSSHRHPQRESSGRGKGPVDAARAQMQSLTPQPQRTGADVEGAGVALSAIAEAARSSDAELLTQAQNIMS